MRIRNWFSFVVVVFLSTLLASNLHFGFAGIVQAQTPAITAPTESFVQSVANVGMTVSDMNQAIDFYSKVLHFQKISDVEISGTPYEQLQGIVGLRERVVQMKLGQETIELTAYFTPKGRPIPIDSHSNDLWFQHIAIVVNDMEKAYTILRQNKVQYVSSEPQTLPPSIPAAAGIKAFYFRDPDGHNLEIIYFPADKGAPRWQSPTKELFLGIDHTAIAVANTEQSLKFYRDILGLKVAGESENFGNEQEHLNNVFGARLHITGLRSQQGPGIEFLEYLSPPGGRPAPDDIHPNDLVYWQTTIVTKDLDILAQRLRESKTFLISPGVVTLPDGKLGFTKALLVRDPDGHALRLVTPN
ncbi:VOC family protein [Microcoleus sp. CAWBG640]|uniref:VOC family protein n=1 Tax=Microcoleus sp. CAWBG640 TaxID=2841653 RepID=UPI00312B908B